MEKVIQISKGKIQQQQNIIIDDLDFELGTDEFAYLIGKTGSGKSSLLKAIYGELKLAEGVGSVAGFNLLVLKLFITLFFENVFIGLIKLSFL